MPTTRSRKQPKTADPAWKAHENESWIFISNAIDTYGLNVYEFRVLAHVARRASTKGFCTASQKTIADYCGMNTRKVMEALKLLCAANILEVTKTGRANKYKLKKSQEWLHPVALSALRRQARQED